MAFTSTLSNAILALSFTGIMTPALALEPPQGRVILVVEGDIAHTNGDNVASFDRQMLKSLGFARWETMTPWTEGIDEYEGPTLSTLLDAVGAKGNNLSVTALNDYTANVPVEDAYEHGVMLAMEMNGEPMSIRDKGPIFLLYPFSETPKLNNEVIHNRSVWQVKSIKID